MDIIIIEDEKVTADDLEETIHQLERTAVVVARLSSVEEGKAYFKEHRLPDLIFSDIQLGDGLSFEIFSGLEITAPIIFCTAYDEYLLDAFRTNGIDYILKPFTKEHIGASLQKYHNLKKSFAGEVQQRYDALIRTLGDKAGHKPEAILVYFQDKILPVKFNDIAFCHIENNICQLETFSGKTYYPNKKLDELETLLSEGFFRINRQCLLNRAAVVTAANYFGRKLSVQLSVPVDKSLLVSKERVPAFLKWLTGG